MSNILNYVQHIFPGGEKKILGGKSPWLRSWPHLVRMAQVTSSFHTKLSAFAIIHLFDSCISKLMWEVTRI